MSLQNGSTITVVYDPPGYEIPVSPPEEIVNTAFLSTQLSLILVCLETQ